MDIIHTTFKTSFGWCGLIKGKKGLKRILLPEKRRKEVILKIKVLCPVSVCSKDGFEKEIKDISAYFRGRMKNFHFYLIFPVQQIFKEWYGLKQQKYLMGKPEPTCL